MGVAPLVTEGMQVRMPPDDRVGHLVRPAEGEPAPAGRSGRGAKEQPPPVAAPGTPTRITMVRTRNPRR
jgi:hypothetical protein